MDEISSKKGIRLLARSERQQHRTTITSIVPESASLFCQSARISNKEILNNLPITCHCSLFAPQNTHQPIL
jgi:hypothetical protein